MLFQNYLSILLVSTSHWLVITKELKIEHEWRRSAFSKYSSKFFVSTEVEYFEKVKETGRNYQLHIHPWPSFKSNGCIFSFTWMCRWICSQTAKVAKHPRNYEVFHRNSNNFIEKMMQLTKLLRKSFQHNLTTSISFLTFFCEIC